MTVTYDPDLATARDRVRFALGQTASTSPLQDEEIAAILAAQPSTDAGEVAAARACCDALIAYHSNSAITRNGRLYVDPSNRVPYFRQLRADLGKKSSLTGASGGGVLGGIRVGGASYTERDTLLSNTDNIPPLFDEVSRRDDIIPADTSDADERGY